MKELIKKMNLHTINVEGDFIISEEQLEAFAKMYHKEQLALYGVGNRYLNTLESIDADTKEMVDRVSRKGYVMNEHDNREMKMRIDALKSALYGC